MIWKYTANDEDIKVFQEMESENYVERKIFLI